MQPARERTASNAVLEAIKAESADGSNVNWKTIESGTRHGAVQHRRSRPPRLLSGRLACSRRSPAFRMARSLEVNIVGREGAAGIIGGIGQLRSLREGRRAGQRDSCAVPVRWMRSEFARSEGVRALVIRHIENLIFQVQQSAVCATRHSVEARLARWLLAIQDRAACNNMRFTHEFVAGHLGVNRTSVTLAAAELQRIGTHHLSPRRGVDCRPGRSRRGPHANATARFATACAVCCAELRVPVLGRQQTGALFRALSLNAGGQQGRG